MSASRNVVFYRDRAGPTSLYLLYIADSRALVGHVY